MRMIGTVTGQAGSVTGRQDGVAPRRTSVRAALLLAVVAAGLLRAHAPAAADDVTAADLPRLQRELAAVTATAERLADELAQASARDGGLRIALQDLEEQRDAARDALEARAREVYMTAQPDPLARVREALVSPGLQRIAAAGHAASARVDQELVDAVAQESQQVRALRARVELFRAGLRAQAAGVLQAQDRARALLAQAERLAREDAERARLDALRAALDAVSATVTVALTPAQTRRSQRAQAREAPVVALVEAAGAGYPAGYAPSGAVVEGEASWYGPGFVGNPTASGSPYDPERLTCAHKTLPLGTVVRVSRAGRAISCLVNDRGPYVGDRVIDLSRAGSRALGFDGVARVVIEVLRQV
jgi:rare lipoprotein A (peptidoglycan hydrolase)